MFERQSIDALDADTTLAHAAELRRFADAAEVAVLQCAAHWAELHGVVEHAGPSLSGMQKLTLLGGVGTPKVAEFAPAELGAELGLTTYAARLLVADALDPRHRLPRLWARVKAGQVKPWVGRRVAQQTRDQDSEIAATVDAAVAPWADRLPWTRLEALVDAAIVKADPEAAQQAADERRRQHGVWVTPSVDHETGTCFIRADAVDLRFFDASIDRIADGIAMLGDLASKDLRRARAVGILANPQQTLDLFQAAATAARSIDPADLPADVTSSDGLAEADSFGADDPGRYTDMITATSPPARATVDPRPPATLYVHISQEALLRDTAGVARVEDIGPVTLDQAKRWLRHCNVTVKPVVLPEAMTPVDSYEVPDRFREAVHLMTPADVFPYSANTSRKQDIDHSVPYVAPDRGGPPGQTRIGNLGPFVRFHHRVKTHGRWQVKQPYPGIFVWRSPHGRYFVVDHTGTRPLP